MKINRKSDKQVTMLRGITVGTLISLLMLLIGVGAVSTVVISGKMEIDTARNILRILLSVAVLLGIKTSNSLTMKMPVIHLLVQSAAVLAFLTGVHIFTCDTKFQYVGGTLLYILIGALCAMVIKPRTKSVRNSRNR